MDWSRERKNEFSHENTGFCGERLNERGMELWWDFEERHRNYEKRKKKTERKI